MDFKHTLLYKNWIAICSDADIDWKIILLGL